MTLLPLQFNVSSVGPVTVGRAGMPGRNPEGKGLSDPTGKGEPKRVSFPRVPLGLGSFPDMKREGISPLVPRGREELFFSSDKGSGSVGLGLEVSTLNEELLLPSGIGTEVGRSLSRGTPVPRLREVLFFSSDTGTGSVGNGFEVSTLNEELLLPSGIGTDVGRSLDVGTPVPGRREELLSLTEIEKMVDERVGLLGESTGTGGAVAIDTSPSTEETAKTEEEVDKSITGGLEGGSVWTVESVVTFWIEFSRRKRNFESLLPSPTAAAADITAVKVEVKSKTLSSWSKAMPFAVYRLPDLLGGEKISQVRGGWEGEQGELLQDHYRYYLYYNDRRA